MFRWLGRWCTRFRWPMVGLWVAIAIALSLFAPDINKVAVNDQRAFLPENVPSLQAARLLRDNFPDRVSANTAVAVIDAGTGRTVTAEPAASFVRTVTERYGHLVEEGVLKRVVSPTNADEQTAKALVSPDSQICLIFVSFARPVAGEEGNALVDRVAAQLEGPPAGVSAYLTGDAAVLAAYDHAARRSVDSTTWITIVLVVVILLVVYRSPVSPLIPLFSITTAYLIARGIVAILGDRWLTISGYTNVFIIVTLFGAGTDYCLFLISRFREEMAYDHSPTLATTRTVSTVGETITSSAATVIVGLSTMAFAELGLYNASGPAVAIAVFIGLLAGLTLTPALLSILGAGAFWPRKAKEFTEGRFWSWWSGWITRHPLPVLLIVVAALVPLAVYGRGLHRDYDLLADLSDETPAVQGFSVMARHIDAGATSPLTVLISDHEGISSPEGLRKLARLERELAQLEHVARVTGLHSVLAERQTLSVSHQLKDLAQQVRAGQSSLSSTTDVASLAAQGQGLLDLVSYLKQLALAYPSVISDPSFTRCATALRQIGEAAGVDVTSVVGGLGTLKTGSGSTPLPSGKQPDVGVLRSALDNLAAGLEELAQSFSQQQEAFLLPDIYLAQNQSLRSLRDAYLSPDGKMARISVVLDVGPYTDEAMQTVRKIRELLAKETPPGLLDGTSAIMTDLRDASGRDLLRAIITVLIGVFIVLVWLLRSLVAPIYLLVTILLSYLATLGLIRLVFQDVLHSPGVTWWVPMFMYVMLVALGMDYNIFLMGRVREEVEQLGIRSGIRRAITRTGAIITSAGIIMAGTFSAMMSARILGLVQIGFAVTVGILLDTFVVRTALVPAIAVLLGRYSWWPRRPGENHVPDG